jgi:hypothetical protein
MSDTTAKNIELIAPELETFICQNGDLVALILEDVAGQISSATYGSKQERAQRYLAAHLLSLAYTASQGAGGSGPVVSEKVGDVEVKYGANNFTDKSRYDETPYGRTYMTIRRGCIGAFMTVAP